jgi:hypothetical protein
MGINPNKVHMIELRIEQLEMALSSLMWVVAHQEEELEDFTELINKTEEMSKDSILTAILSEKGASA